MITSEKNKLGTRDFKGYFSGSKYTCWNWKDILAGACGNRTRITNPNKSLITISYDVMTLYWRQSGDALPHNSHRFVDSLACAAALSSI